MEKNVHHCVEQPTGKQLCKIFLSVDTMFSKDAIDELENLGVARLSVETCRGIVLRHRKGLKALIRSGTDLKENAERQITFFALPTQEEKIIHHLVNKLHLNHPGMGSIYSRRVEVVRTTLPCPGKELPIAESGRAPVVKKLRGITCITLKGEGNSVAVVGLNTGTGVPNVSYGKGTGLRNRVGLWRILIPAEKEITTLVVDEHDADTVMDMMISAGKLDRPWKGFIYSYPVSMGVLNTKFYDGETQQAASVEQIVSALDEITGTTEWRKKSLFLQGKGKSRRDYLTNLVDFTVTCNEGLGELMTEFAMEAGAGGATISLMRHVDMCGSETAASSARENISMVVNDKQVGPLTSALEQAGIFNDQASGEIVKSPAYKAFT